MNNKDQSALTETFTVGSLSYEYVSLHRAESLGLAPASRLPMSLRILLENSLRHRHLTTEDDLAAFRAWNALGSSECEISFYPARVLMPDSSGVPLFADLASMRDAVLAAGADPRSVNPMIPIDIVIDHSAITDHAGTADAFDLNLALEYQRNKERYVFLKWAQEAFANTRVVPPAMGIVHQVNLEFLAQGVCTAVNQGRTMAFPDTLVGMDSHTTMINSIGVLGWGVGGIEAAAAMLGEPVSMLLPQVVGCHIIGQAKPGVTCTDIVLSLTEILRKNGVVGKFVEFFGDGLDHLAVSERATIANMAPESGATMCFFPVDHATLHYLRISGRSAEQVDLIEAYAKLQGLWRDGSVNDIAYSVILEFDLGAVGPSMAGPRRPQDRRDLSDVAHNFSLEYANRLLPLSPTSAAPTLDKTADQLTHGSIVIAAITSCTNTANARAMIGAGLIARKLRARGIAPKPWVKTSLSPGSRVVTDYLIQAGLQADLDALGFNLVGYGCMTCAGSSGQLAPWVAERIDAQQLVVATVLSGNRNFEGRTHPLARANYLGSPALVVAYACAGTITIDLTSEPIAVDPSGQPVYLEDVWPPDAEIDALLAHTITPELFKRRYASVFRGDRRWQKLPVSTELNFPWDAASTYLRRPPYFDAEVAAEKFGQTDIISARSLLLLGNSITTDHISPVGAIAPASQAGAYLSSQQVTVSDFNTLLARRANHDVMVRGTFANSRINNLMVAGQEGPWTRHMPDDALMSIYDAACRYRAEGVPLIVVAGADYGSGSSRDWAAKGPRMLGVRAVIAESFERIHRSNLVGMAVLPLQFQPGVTRETLQLTGSETFTLRGLEKALTPRQMLSCEIHHADGSRTTIMLICRLDIAREVEWYRHGGILHYVAAKLIRQSSGFAAVTT